MCLGSFLVILTPFPILATKLNLADGMGGEALKTLWDFTTLPKSAQIY